MVIFHSHVSLPEGNMQTLSLTLSLTINLIIVMFHSHGTFTRGYVSFHSHPLLLKMFPIAIQLYPTPRQFAQRWLNSMRSEHHVCCLNPMVWDIYKHHWYGTYLQFRSWNGHWKNTIWSWKIPYKWRFIAGNIICKWTIFHSYVKEPEGKFKASWRDINKNINPQLRCSRTRAGFG